MEPVGHHYVAEASGCDASIIGKVETVEGILTRAAEVAGVTIWAISFHRFAPNGVSGVIVISESHLSVHTWPEHGYVALDIFTCGDDAKPEAAVEHALKAFGAKSMHITEISRGLQEGGDKQFFHSIVTWEETLARNGRKRPAIRRQAGGRRPARAR